MNNRKYVFNDLLQTHLVLMLRISEAMPPVPTCIFVGRCLIKQDHPYFLVQMHCPLYTNWSSRCTCNCTSFTCICCTNSSKPKSHPSNTAFNDSVSTSQKEYWISIAKMKQLMLFREVITLYYMNHMKCMSVLCVHNAEFWFSQWVLHVTTSQFLRDSFCSSIL